MKALREVYGRIMGSEGTRQIVGGFVLAAVLLALVLFRELFGLTATQVLIGGFFVFVGGAYFGMWLERKRISEAIGVDIKFGL